MTKAEIIRETLEKGGGVLRLTPTWVPRPFNRPGRRIAKKHLTKMKKCAARP